MILPRRAVNFLLIALFACAVWVRMESLGSPAYPYYKGESATNFRQTLQIAERGTLPDIDKRVAWPEGISPAREKANGAEYFVGFAYRLADPFTDLSHKRFANILIVLLFSSSVFVLYPLTRRLWSSGAAGLCAAGLAAFSAPIIAVTNGNAYHHDIFAFVIVSFHLLMALGAVERPTLARTILSGVAIFVLLAVWEPAGLYVGGFCLAWTLLPGIEASARRRLLVALLAGTAAAGLAAPNLLASRFIFTWPSALVIAATAWTFTRARLPARLPGWAAFGGTFAALVLIFTPIAAGAEGGISPLGYWLYRIRFLAGRPDDPSLIPETIRVFWSISHAPPQPFTVLAFLLPLAFLVVPAASEIRALGNRSRVPAWLLAGVALGAIALFLLDRRAILVAALIVFPLVSGVFRGFGGRMKTRAVPAAIAAVIVFTSLPLVSGNPGATAAIGGLVGIHRGGGSDFVWVSVGNADRDLVRHLVSRTSTRRDVILAPPEIASLIPTFAGRATILTPGITTKTMAQKTVDALTAYYGDDDDLYTYCEALGATHVLYSIDLILDSSRYSPGYTAGTGGISEMTAVYRMHFEPEALRHFQLVYENDNFRLFRVTDDTKPTFLTDHPPVYQKRILEVHGDTIESFYNRIVDILFAYQSAVDAQSNGDEEGALRRLRYCLDQAPAFTYAWLRVGDSLLRLDRPADAFNAYNRVLQYAPDNRHALYYGALALGLEDRREEAVQLLELLLTSTADRGTRAQAAELKRAIESGQTITMPE